MSAEPYTSSYFAADGEHVAGNTRLYLFPVVPCDRNIRTVCSLPLRVRTIIPLAERGSRCRGNNLLLEWISQHRYFADRCFWYATYISPFSRVCTLVDASIPPPVVARVQSSTLLSSCAIEFSRYSTWN